jgi:hypothetical protein
LEHISYRKGQILENQGAFCAATICTVMRKSFCEFGQNIITNSDFVKQELH